jgi:precorrin-6A/cobalt-precorrin-6A reductase
MTILIIGGTAEARALAAALVGSGVDVITSLAGRVRDPALPAGPVRIGGFGGVAGLVAFLIEQRISAVVDASHPFAAQISTNIERASVEVGVPLLRLERPGWADHSQAGSWIWAGDAEGAREAAEAYRRPFLTTGRQSLPTFLVWADRPVLARVVDPPEFALPERWTLIISRGPYDYPDERQLLTEHSVEVLITKDSGGQHTVAKLDAAGDLGIPVVIIARPAHSAAAPHVPAVSEALTWLLANSAA